MEKQKDIKELLGIVGKDRGKYSDAVIAEAEKAIEARWGKAQDMLRKRILRAGSITSLIGVVMLGAGLLGVFMLVDMYEGFWDYGSSEDSAKEILYLTGDIGRVWSCRRRDRFSQRSRMVKACHRRGHYPWAVLRSYSLNCVGDTDCCCVRS